MKSLRGVTPALVLLIVGILIAPGASEAAPPMLTISGDTISGAPTVQLGVSSVCSGTDKSAGFTACYAIPTPQTFGSPSYTLQSVASTNPARLLIADTTGSGNSLDKFTLTGLKIIPPSGGGNVTLTATNTFDAAPNLTGSYQYALRTAGYFLAPIGSSVNTGDSLRFQGNGNFGSGGRFIDELDVNILGPNAPAISFTFASLQDPSTHLYPSFPCDTGGACSPTITQTMSISFGATDTLFLTNSDDGAGGIGTCDVRPPTNVPPGPPTGLPRGPAHPCQSHASQTPIEDQITNFFNDQEKKDEKAANQAGAVPCIGSDSSSCYSFGGDD